MEKRVGFDVDGVFLPDYCGEYDEKFESYLSLRTSRMVPLFEPPFIEFWLITGRPIQDKKSLESWVNEFFSSPQKIHVCCGVSSDDFKREDKVVEYKAKMIMENNLDHFVESSLKQAVCIQNILRSQKSSCKVHYFTPLIIKGIAGALK